MGLLQTVLPFTLAATEAPIAYRGLALVGEYVRAMTAFAARSKT